MAENRLAAPVLGVAWDGTGFGPDGTVWGGEFLRVTADSFERAAHLRTFLLPGGEAAVREPRRSALGLLFELFGEALFDRPDLTRLCGFPPAETAVLRTAIARRLNAPRTSSMGRLFDGVSAILGLRRRCRFAGQAAMDLEFAVREGVDAGYEFALAGGSGTADCIVVDWEPAILQVLADLRGGLSARDVAARFHNGLARLVVRVARVLGEEQVVLTGGCFQNACLLRKTVEGLRDAAFRPYWHQRIPPNDGGIALGQVVAGARALAGRAAATPRHGKTGDRHVPCHSG